MGVRHSRGCEARTQLRSMLYERWKREESVSAAPVSISRICRGSKRGRCEGSMARLSSASAVSVCEGSGRVNGAGVKGARHVCRAPWRCPCGRRPFERRCRACRVRGGPRGPTSGCTHPTRGNETLRRQTCTRRCAAGGVRSDVVVCRGGCRMRDVGGKDVRN